MSERRIVIGAIGGDRQQAWAEGFGGAVARAGCILLTGGGRIDNEEVKNATFFGIKRKNDPALVARAIGILDEKPVNWDYSKPPQLLLSTGFSHNVRNLINGVTPDVVVVFGGSRGTLAEMAFAAARNKPLFFFGISHSREPVIDQTMTSAVERLQHNYAKYFLGEDSATHVACYLDAPLRAFPGVVDKTSEELINLIGLTLNSASDWQKSAEELVQSCIEKVDQRSLDLPTGFPFLQCDPKSKGKFEDCVREISRF